MDYSDYKELKITRLEPGILEVVMRAEPGKLSVTNARGSVNPATTNQYRGKAPAAKILVQSLDLDGIGVTDAELQTNAGCLRLKTRPESGGFFPRTSK